MKRGKAEILRRKKYQKTIEKNYKKEGKEMNASNKECLKITLDRSFEFEHLLDRLDKNLRK